MTRNPDRTNVRGMWGLTHRSQNDYAAEKQYDCVEEMESCREDVVFRCHGNDDEDNSHRTELEGYTYCYGDNWQRTLS